METKLSTKGQVVLPSPIRRKLCLQPGDVLHAELKGDHVVLTPKKGRRRRARIVKDPRTGLPVLTLGSNAPQLTDAYVREMLADFP